MTRHDDDYVPRNPGFLFDWDQFFNPNRYVIPNNRNLIPHFIKAREKDLEILRRSPKHPRLERVRKPIKIVTIKMTKTNIGSPDGYNVYTYEEGKTYLVSESLAENFIGQGCAVLHVDPKNKKEKEK